MTELSLPVVVVFTEKVRHDVGAGVASVVQARKAESCFYRLQQREVRIEFRTLLAVVSIVGVHDQQNFVRGWRHAVIVFVPHSDDRAAPVSPGRRMVDRIDDLFQSGIAVVDQCRVQADLGAVVVRIVLAVGPGVTASVLVMALIRHDVGIRGQRVPSLGLQRARLGR